MRSLLSLERSATIVSEAQKMLRKQIDTGVLTPERMKEIVSSPQNAQLCYVAQFFANAGATGAYPQVELRNREFVLYLVDHPEIFKMLAQAGYANRNVLTVLQESWSKSGKTLSPVELRMSLGAGLIADEFKMEETIAKLDFYLESYKYNKCYPQATTLQPWEWAIVFRGKESIEDLTWAQAHIEGKDIKPEQAGGKFMGFIPYRANNKEGISIHAGASFYDKKPITLKLYTEYGGVCGAVSKGASGFLRSKGVPAYPIGQPGHCAFIWKQPDGKWVIGNNIGGWNWATGGTKLPWQGPVQIIKTLHAFLNAPNADEPALLCYLSACSQNAKNAETLLGEARKLSPLNFPAWMLYLNRATRLSDKKKLEFLKEFALAMPTEHNITSYVAQTVLEIDPERVNPYELYATFIDPDCTEQAEELFTRNVWGMLIKRCPEIAEYVEYKKGTTGRFLTHSVNTLRHIKWTKKMQSEAARVFCQAILALKDRKASQTHYIDMYRILIKAWDNPKLTKEAEVFISSQLKENSK